MIHWLKYHFLHVFLAMVFALASAVNGGAHKISEPIDEATRAYFLEMGATLDDLCGDIGSSSGLTSSCEVCNLASAAILPIRFDLLRSAEYASAILVTDAVQASPPTPNAFQNTIRGPPLV